MYGFTGNIYLHENNGQKKLWDRTDVKVGNLVKISVSTTYLLGDLFVYSLNCLLTYFLRLCDRTC